MELLVVEAQPHRTILASPAGFFSSLAQNDTLQQMIGSWRGSHQNGLIRAI